MPYVVEFSLESKLVDGREGQSQEQHDPAVKPQECISKSSLNFLFASLNRSRVRDSPLCACRMPRPYWADFFCRTVTHGEDEVDSRSIRSCELVPRLTPEFSRLEVSRFEFSQCFWSHRTCGTASGAVRREPGFAPRIHDAFRHNRTGRVAGAKEQHVVVIRRHLSCSPLGHGTTSRASLHEQTRS